MNGPVPDLTGDVLITTGAVKSQLNGSKAMRRRAVDSFLIRRPISAFTASVTLILILGHLQRMRDGKRIAVVLPNIMRFWYHYVEPVPSKRFACLSK